MKQKWLLIICIVLLVYTMIVVGCGKNPVLTTLNNAGTTNGGIRITATIVSLLKGQSVPRASAYMTPTNYSIAVSSVKLLKSIDDNTPYVIFDKGSVNKSVELDLTATAEKEFGSNTAYPVSGTYNYLEYHLLYIKQEITYYDWPNAGANSIVYRAFASSYGTAQPLDVQVFYLNENVWKWDGNNGTMYEVRPATVYQVDWDFTLGWKENNTYYVAQKDPAIIRVPLASSLVIPDSPTGIYVGKMSFNISNKLKWQDRDGDGKLDTGDESQYVGQGSQVNPLPPEVTVTFTKQ